MRMLRMIVPALLAFLLLAGATSSTSAQGTPAASVEDIEGVERAYSRTFSVDETSLSNPASPEAAPTGWFTLTTAVVEFDNEENAMAGFEVQAAVMNTTGVDMQFEDVELDLDFKHTAQQAEEKQGAVTTSMMLVTAQDGEYVYAVAALTFGEDPTPVVESTIRAMRDADVSDDDEIFNTDGASKGGLWAKLPSAEDVTEQLEALTTVTDTIFVPQQEGTPAA